MCPLQKRTSFYPNFNLKFLSLFLKFIGSINLKGVLKKASLKTCRLLEVTFPAPRAVFASICISQYQGDKKVNATYQSCQICQMRDQRFDICFMNTVLTS